jgi:hypothetical protein
VVRDDGVELPIVLPADQLDEVLILFELPVGVYLDGILVHVGWRCADDGPEVDPDRHVPAVDLRVGL